MSSRVMKPSKAHEWVVAKYEHERMRPMIDAMKPEKTFDGQGKGETRVLHATTLVYGERFFIGLSTVEGDVEFSADVGIQLAHWILENFVPIEVEEDTVTDTGHPEVDLALDLMAKMKSNDA